MVYKITQRYNPGGGWSISDYTEVQPGMRMVYRRLHTGTTLEEDGLYDYTEVQPWRRMVYKTSLRYDPGGGKYIRLL